MLWWFAIGQIISYDLLGQLYILCREKNGLPKCLFFLFDMSRKPKYSARYNRLVIPFSLQSNTKNNNMLKHAVECLLLSNNNSRYLPALNYM